MENPQSESTVTPVEIKKDKLSENMESPTNTTNDENTPVLQDEANTPISHRPNQEGAVTENVDSVPLINVTTEEENTGNIKPDASIYDNALHNPPVIENTATISPSENITSSALPPAINTSDVPGNINNPSLNSASSTGEVIASAWTSVSNYLWSWFEQPPEEGDNQANNDNTNANANNNNNNNNTSTTNTQNESTTEGGAGYYANLLSSFFTRPATNTSNTQTLEKRTSVSSLSSSRLNLLSQQARMPSIQFIGVENHEEEVGAVKPIINRELSEYIRPHLPPYQRESVKWILRYSTTQHGISLNTLYQKVEKAGPLLLAIRDTENNVFGAYVSEPFHITKGFYGTRECFLWKYIKGGLKMYPTSGNNEYFILSEPDYIAIGGGNGSYGLFIDEDIQNGQSDECTAFFNEPLSSSSRFQILSLEVWSFEM